MPHKEYSHAVVVFHYFKIREALIADAFWGAPLPGDWHQKRGLRGLNGAQCDYVINDGVLCFLTNDRELLERFKTFINAVPVDPYVEKLRGGE